jgi:dimeric dUTPase (all-alpha-NTP-PPase superfamily)
MMIPFFNYGEMLVSTHAQQQAFCTMLAMQDRMNQRVHPQWIDQQYEWYRAVWIECGELMDHQGYKWWKKQDTDLEQVQLEVVDIWHFGMSALFAAGKSHEAIAAEMLAELENSEQKSTDVLTATEALANHSLVSRSFSVALFRDLLLAVGLDFVTLYRQYVGKNVLNFFRQDHGYKDGSYIKTWAGKEDNVHLVEVLTELDSDAADFADQVYAALASRYPGA